MYIALYPVPFFYVNYENNSKSSDKTYIKNSIKPLLIDFTSLFLNCIFFKSIRNII